MTKQIVVTLVVLFSVGCGSSSNKIEEKPAVEQSRIEQDVVSESKTEIEKKETIVPDTESSDTDSSKDVVSQELRLEAPSDTDFRKLWVSDTKKRNEKKLEMKCENGECQLIDRLGGPSPLYILRRGKAIMRELEEEDGKEREEELKRQEQDSETIGR